ncbi:MAG: LacI family DNA-binding transcriptional regulator [Erysipelotrichaceae bacterium]|nr:LacI family DNA-binding transcriptional regulator [Erysipelotrichaceae bacterium]
MVSIKDIAKKCGVSVAAVSKALNDRSDISKATKNRILKTAEEMGYMPNISARTLRTNRTYNIGILFVGSEPGLSHEYFSNILDSFKDEAEENGYNITFVNDRIAGRKVTFKNNCEYRNFDGVAVITADFNDENVIELVNSGIPAVTLDYVYDNCSSVVSDNMEGMSKLVEYAIEMGHTKIAYIHGEDTKVTENRIAGFYSAMRRNRINVPDEYLVEARYHNPKLCIEVFEKLLKLSDPPTCVIFPDDYSTVVAINSLGESRQNISFMGYDGIELSRVLNLTTYEQNKTELGRTAAKKLITRIENPDAPIEHVTSSGRLIKGNTLKKI